MINESVFDRLAQLAKECDGIYHFAEHPAAVVTYEMLAALRDKAAKWDEHERKAQAGCDFDLGGDE